MSARKEGPLSSALRAFRDHALSLVQHLNYALTHPKHLAGLLEPITSEERIHIERETADVAVNSLHELIDVNKRPTVVRVIRKLFGVSAKLLSTLITLSSAENILSSDPDDWPLNDAVVVPVRNPPFQSFKCTSLIRCYYHLTIASEGHRR